MHDIGVPGITGAELIGQGAFGKVYRAEQADLNREVAVKVLANVDLDAEARTRFTREARAIGRMSGHPNIVNVYAQGATEDGTPYLLMEYCARGSLGDRIKRGDRLSWQEATEVVVEIAGALQTAHAAGILHRDIKPANILLDGYGTAKLADFGIARMGTDVSVTQTGMLTGSPAHLAPELIAGEQPTPASDVYSLASTLHALITGHAPFVRETDTSVLSLLQRVSHEPAPHLAQWGVPAPVADLVAATLAKDPAARPRSCADFARALMAARGHLGLAPGDYRVQQAEPTGGDATVVPAWASPPSSPAPAATYTRPGPATHPPAQPPMPMPMPLPTPVGAVAVARPNTAIIVASWVIVAVSLLLIALMLVNR